MRTYADIEFDGMDELLRRLRAIKETEPLLVEVQLAAVEEAKKRAQPFKKTGNLQRNIVPGTVTRTSAMVRARAGYSAYVEYGTGIHGPKGKPIVPRTKKVLSWVGGGSRLTGRGPGGQRIFARSVKGRRATPFLIPGAVAALRSVGLDKMADRLITRWNKAG